MSDAHTLLAFAIASLALNITPGADMTFVAASSARGGIRHGLAAALGIGAGSLVHIAAATFGLSALIASSQAAFSVLKWVGAAYLAYVAFGLFAGGGTPAAERPVPSRTTWEVFRTGALVNVLNPKVGLFMLAFLPQFVDRAAPHVAGQTLFLGLWFDLSGTLVNVVVAVVAARLAAGVRGVPGLGLAVRWIAGTVMGALAVRLVATERP